MSRFLITIGLMAMLAFSIVLFITFATAYMSPAKAVNVKINSFGEADIEMLLLSMLLPVSIATTVMVTRKIDEEEKITRIIGEMKKEMGIKDLR